MDESKGRVHMKNKKRKKYSKFDQLLELPREVASSDSKITIHGLEEMLIENYKNIIEYQDVFVKVNTFEGAISIYGMELKLEQMTEEDIKVIGKIDSIELEKTND